MKRIFLVLMLLAMPKAHAQEPIEWRDLDLNLLKLGPLKTDEYAFLKADEDGALVKVGKFTFSTEVTREFVLLTDKFEAEFLGERIELEMEQRCGLNNFLSPSKIKVDVRGESDEVSPFTVDIADGKAKFIEGDKRAKGMKIPQETITRQALMRLLTLLPKAPGKTYVFSHCLEAEEMNLKDNFQVRVLESEFIKYKDREIKCSKFEVTGEGVMPSYYWVDRAAKVQRVRIDGRKILQLVPEN